MKTFAVAAGFVSVVLALSLGFSPPAALAQAREHPAAEAPVEPPASDEPSAGRTNIATLAPSFDVEAATRAYLDRLSPEEKARSDAYFEGGYWLQLWELLLELGVAALLLFAGIGARMRNLAERLTRRAPLQSALFGVQYLSLTVLLTLPLVLYRDFFREHRYGLATQAFGAWLADFAIETSVVMVFMTLALVAVYGVIRKAPRTWWVWAALVIMAFLTLVLIIGPVYLDPLLNTYEPLADQQVLEPILSMARANGVDVDQVLQFDASRQTTRVSGNVSGFAGTMAIRLNDNLLNRCTPAEIQSVMGHELGHYVLNHTYELLLSMGLLLVVGGAFVRWAAEGALARWGASWGVRAVGDLASLPLLVALLALYFFLATPVLNTIIRVNEAEADAFGLNAARKPDGFAEIALKLGEYRKLEPSPLEEWIFFDHPSGASRIRMAMRWKAENLPTTPTPPQ